MLRLLLPIHSFEPGGVERVALRLARAWQDKGLSTHLILGRDEGRRPHAASELEFDVLQRGRLSTAAVETFWMILHLPGRIRRSRPDLIFCPGNSYAVVAVALKLLLGRSCPPIILKISNDLRRADMNPVARLAYRLWCRVQGRLIDHFVALAEPMADEVAAMTGVHLQRVAVIHNPVLSHAQIEELRRARSIAVRERAGRHFLAVGRLVPQKNFPLLVRAFSRIAGPEDRLAILGEGPDRAKLERLVRKLGLQEQVFLPGHVDAIDDWLATADTFVLSSDFEGLPAVVLEAMAAGVQIVATDCSTSMQMLLDEGRLGRIVPVGDEDALAGGMASASPACARAAAAMSARFTVERAAMAYAGLFCSIVAAASQSCGDRDAAASQGRSIWSSRVSR